jgi:hypothetical protein
MWWDVGPLCMQTEHASHSTARQTVAARERPHKEKQLVKDTNGSTDQPYKLYDDNVRMLNIVVTHYWTRSSVHFNYAPHKAYN